MKNTTTQIEELLNVDNNDSNQSMMKAALNLASKEMGVFVSLSNEQLKVWLRRAPFHNG